MVFGGPGDDNVSGGAGTDDLNGGLDNDTVSGGEGNDFLRDTQGDDTYIGEADVDTIDFTRSDVGIVADLTAGTVEGENAETLSSVENVLGSSFRDSITGDDGVNYLGRGSSPRPAVR